MFCFGLKLIWKSFPSSTWIHSIYCVNSRYIDKHKELKISQRGHSLIVTIFSLKKLKKVWVSKSNLNAEIRLRCATLTQGKKLKLFSYKTSKADLKDFVAMEVSQIRGLQGSFWGCFPKSSTGCFFYIPTFGNETVLLRNCPDSAIEADTSVQA